MTARALGYTIVTNNVKEFDRVKNRKGSINSPYE